MSRQGHVNAVEDSELECLILWPDGTVGAQQERQLVRLLNRLCQKHGYGRVPQLAAAIEAIWRDPDKGAEFVASKTAHLDFMEECKRHTGGAS